MGTHKIYSGIQGIRDNISGSLYGDCHELLAEKRLPISYLALKFRYINKTHTESGVEKSLFQFSLRLLI